MTIGLVLLGATVVATTWMLRADPQRESFARERRRVMLSFALINLLAAVALISTQWPG